MLSYRQRMKFCTNPTALKLLGLIEEKKSNLAAAVDVIHKKELLYLADMLGPEICVLKTHIDILEDFDYDTVQQLTTLAKTHNFIIFEDRKFADIGNTVQLQYRKGIYRIAEWATITNAHTLPGPDVITGLKDVGLPLGNGLLLLAEMSSKGALMNDEYIRQTLRMANDHKDFVIGFITQKKLIDDPTFINMTPGVQTAGQEDGYGQQYVTPWKAIYEHQSDIIIVGRGIYCSSHPLQTAKLYREQGWEAYQQKLRRQ
jgi:orotidine 5'-phosphate decarboxylase subfamily 1